MLPSPEQELLLVLVGFSCALFCIVVARSKPSAKNNRTSFLWKLVIVNALLFSIGLEALVITLPQSFLNIFSWIIYDLIITYVVSIEVPAYLKISNFDDDFAEALQGLREELIRMPFEFGSSLQNLKTKRNDNALYLKGNNLDKLLEDFITFCDKVENLNERLWSLTLNETSDLIEETTKRSKHPFPKLIDILALSGLSFLIAQFLKLLG